MEFLAKIFAKEGLVIDKGATINGLVNGPISDRYLVSDNGEVKYRTAAQVLSDIGGATAASGLPIGGTAGQILAKINSTNYNAQWIDNYTEDVRQTVKAGESINKGQAVYISGADGTNPVVSKASNSSEATSSKTLGLLAQNLANNGQGFVITEGRLSGLDTSSAQIADPVWLGVNGNLIFGLANKPVAPAHLVYLGVVTRVNANNGEIFVHVVNGFELNEIHDVLIQSVANKDILYRDASTNLWKNASIATILGYTPADNSALSNYQLKSEKAQPNGYASLDSNGKVPLSQMNDSIIGQVEYMGLWNASTNAPTLSVPPQEKGHYYIVSTAGTQFGISFEVGDWIISDGASWSKVDNTDAVSSVFGRVGNITAVEADYQDYYVRLSQVYADPSWISALAWSKITGTPTTLGGYGITDAVPSSRTITINGTTLDLSANRSWTISEQDTLATVTGRGNTTTSNIYVGQYLRTGSYPHFGETVGGLATLVGNNILPGSGINKIVRYAGGDNGTYINLRYNAGIIFATGVTSTPGVEVDDTTGEAMRITTNRNVLIGTTVDTGSYKLDVYGEIRGYMYRGANGAPLITFDSATNRVRIDNQGYGTTISNSLIVGDYLHVEAKATFNSYLRAKGDNSVITYAIGRPDATSIDNASLAGMGVKFNTPWYTGAGLSFYVSEGTDISGGFNVAEKLNLSPSGDLKIFNLSGTGTRMVVADSSGVLTTQAIPSIPVLSVFGRTGNVTAQSGDYTTAQVTESGNLYYTDARARVAISLTTSGNSGAATYNSTTGVLNIPNYSNALSSYVPYSGATSNVNLGNNTLSVGFINILGGSAGAAGYLGFKQSLSTITAGAGYTSITAEDKSYLVWHFDQNGGTNYKWVRFNISGVTNNTLRTYNLPNADGTIALTGDIPTNNNQLTNGAGYITSSALMGYVPYSGASANVNLGANYLIAQRFQSTGGELISVLLKGRSSDNKSQLQFYDNSGGNLYGYIESAPSGLNGSLNIVSGNSYIQLTNTYVSTTSLLVNATTDNGSGAKLQVNGAATFNNNVRVDAILNIGSNAGNGSVFQYNYFSGNVDSRTWRTSIDNVVYGDWALQQATTQGGNTYANILRFSNTGAATFSSSVTAGGALSATSGSFVSSADNFIRIETTGTNNARLDLVTPSYYYVIQNLQAGGANRFRIYDNTAGAERFSISSSGNIGIGVTPSAWANDWRVVQLGGTVSTYSSGAIGINTYNAYYDGASYRYVNSAVAAIYDFNGASAGGFAWRIGASGTAGNAISFTQAMTLTSGGILMVGTTTILGGGGVEASNGLNIYQNGTITSNSTSDYNAYFAKRSGYSFGGFIGFYVANNLVGSISTNGTTTSYNTSSDYRLKTDLKDFAGVDLVNSLKVYDYQWLSDKSRSYGVLAHELQSVLPYAVTGVKDGEQMQGVDYSKIVPVLIKAIQELNNKISK